MVFEGKAVGQAGQGVVAGEVALLRLLGFQIGLEVDFAQRLLDRLEHVIEGLAHMPERGSYPRELSALGIRAYRQTFFKPYRVIYRVTGRQVVIHLIADGRRDMRTLLARRLLGA